MPPWIKKLLISTFHFGQLWRLLVSTDGLRMLCHSDGKKSLWRIGTEWQVQNTRIQYAGRMKVKSFPKISNSLIFWEIDFLAET